ncbi:MAG: hypothetical protein D6753_08765 [Planctomycetota bacterium]|nr:MAG: hypothetical protein D6753_08765 [Planctomycetota bacterium]
MFDPWVDREWKDLCYRLDICAQHHGSKIDRAEEFLEASRHFAQRTPPQRYPELLDAVRGAAELAKSWQRYAEAADREPADPVEEALEETYPASDAPTWTATEI